MPILPFIQERLSAVEKEIKADLLHWLSGKKHPNLAFDGSLVLNYWGKYIDENVSKIIQTAFVANRELAVEHDLDPANSIDDAMQASEHVILEILNTMVDYDQKMRGKGNPNTVAKKDIEEIKKKFSKAVADRGSNEMSLFNMPRKNTIKLPLESNHGLYWFIKNCHWSIYPVLLGLVVTIFFAGFKAGKNDTFRKLYDVLTSNSNALEISQPQKPPIKPATIDQKTTSIKQTGINKNKP